MKRKNILLKKPIVKNKRVKKDYDEEVIDEIYLEEIFKELPYTKRGNRIRRVIDEEIKYLRS